MHKTNIKCNSISKRIVRTAYQTINVYQKLTQLNRKHKRVKENDPNPCWIETLTWTLNLWVMLHNYPSWMQVGLAFRFWIAIRIWILDEGVDSGQGVGLGFRISILDLDAAPNLTPYVHKCKIGMHIQDPHVSEHPNLNAESNSRI